MGKPLNHKGEELERQALEFYQHIAALHTLDHGQLNKKSDSYFRIARDEKEGWVQQTYTLGPTGRELGEFAMNASVSFQKLTSEMGLHISLKYMTCQPPAIGQFNMRPATRSLLATSVKR